MEASPADAWRCSCCRPVDGAPHGCSGDVLDQLRKNAGRETRRRWKPKASEPAEIQQEQEEIQQEQEQDKIKEEEIQLEQEQEEIKEEIQLKQDEIQQEQEEVDFSALLARRQQFVEEIRHNRFHPKNNKELIPSCAARKYDVEEVDKIAERSCDLRTTLVEKNTEEFFSGEGITDYLRPQPLLALDNVTHSCILTTKCYHRRFRTDDITETDPSYRELKPENMVQIFSLTLPKTYPCSVSIYGIFAIRDVLHPGRNYLFKRSRDNSITIHPGSRLPLVSPCRGIYSLTRTLLDVDLRIKHEGDDESADEKFVAGYFELLVRCYYNMRFCQRLHDGIRSHFLDIDYRYIGRSIAATVIASAEVPYPCQVTFIAYTSSFDDEVTIFDGSCCEGEVQFRHVVAVKVLCTLELCLKLDGMCYSHSFKAGVDSKPVKFGPVKALVVWSECHTDY